MPKKSKRKTTATVIEIDDSTDDESATTSDSTISKPSQQQRKSLPISNRHTTSKQADTIQKEPNSSSTALSKNPSDEFDIPKRIISRRKSVHHSIRSTENLSFEFDTQRKRRESVDDVSSKLNKKKRWNDSQIDDAVDHNLDDPEIEQMLKKIAYCRVFTNYLLRQYDMLAIDFKLYSNLDMLNLDLKMRVDTYTAIRNSRQRFREAREMKSGQIQL